MHSPRDIHWAAVKRILRYLNIQYPKGYFFPHNHTMLSMHIQMPIGHLILMIGGQ